MTGFLLAQMRPWDRVSTKRAVVVVTPGPWGSSSGTCAQALGSILVQQTH